MLSSRAPAGFYKVSYGERDGSQSLHWQLALNVEIPRVRKSFFLNISPARDDTIWICSNIRLKNPIPSLCEHRIV